MITIIIFEFFFMFFVLSFFNWFDFFQPSEQLASQNTTYCTACQCDRNIQQQYNSAQTKYDKVCGDARSRCREHIRKHESVLRFHIELSRCPHDAVDDKSGDNVAYRGQSPHAAHHSQRKSDSALHRAHDRAAPELWHKPDCHDQKHEGKGRAYPSGYVQSVRKDICRGRNEPF